LAKADKLLDNPHRGQLEEYLGTDRAMASEIIEGHYKIVYRIEAETIS
jgi:plasmid stabilization system protein ParE